MTVESITCARVRLILCVAGVGTVVLASLALLADDMRAQYFRRLDICLARVSQNAASNGAISNFHTIRKRQHYDQIRVMSPLPRGP